MSNELVPQHADTNDIPTLNAIGKRGLWRKEGFEKASGSAMYPRDIQLPGMLYARCLLSPYAHAKIISMDTTMAASLDGVRDILRYDDPYIVLGQTFEQVGDIFCSRNVSSHGQAALGQIAYCEGQPIGVAICADSLDICDEALKLVNIEWEVRDFILDMEEALQSGAPLVNPELSPEDNYLSSPSKVIQGNIDEGFQQADKTIEFSFNRTAHTVGHPMPTTWTANWVGGYLDLWTASDSSGAKFQIARVCGIAVNKLIEHRYYMPAHYGGWPATSWGGGGPGIIAAILAKRTGKPVKVMAQARTSSFNMVQMDEANRTLKVGVKNDGTITAVSADVIMSESPTIGQLHLQENTRIPNICFNFHGAALRNKPLTSSHRCEQMPNTEVINEVFGHVTEELVLDPTEVALLNDGCEGHSMDSLSEYKVEHGWPDRDSLKECIEAGRAAFDWDNKWHAPGVKKLPNGNYHGVAFVWTHEWNDVSYWASHVGIGVERDGKATIYCYKNDKGLNNQSTYSQIVADEIGLLYEDVDYRLWDPSWGFYGAASGSSLALASNSYALKGAARKVRQRILEYATSPIYSYFMRVYGVPPTVHFPNLTPDDLGIINSMIFEKANPENKKSVAEVIGSTFNTFVMGDELGYEFATKSPIFEQYWSPGPFNLYTQHRPRLVRQGHFFEVEVDPDTGEFYTMNTVLVCDVGRAISPETVEGQMYGGMYMAYGNNTTEMIWDKSTGVMLNDNFIEYKYPTSLDYGPIKSIIIETGMGYGAYGIVGVGEDTADECASYLPIAIHNAIGKWVDEFPITPDKVLKALGKV